MHIKQHGHPPTYTSCVGRIQPSALPGKVLLAVFGQSRESSTVLLVLVVWHTRRLPWVAYTNRSPYHAPKVTQPMTMAGCSSNSSACTAAAGQHDAGQHNAAVSATLISTTQIGQQVKSLSPENSAARTARPIPTHQARPIPTQQGPQPIFS